MRAVLLLLAGLVAIGMRSTSAIAALILTEASGRYIGPSKSRKV